MHDTEYSVNNVVYNTLMVFICLPVIHWLQQNTDAVYFASCNLLALTEISVV